jgi:hypothetical protein
MMVGEPFADFRKSRKFLGSKVINYFEELLYGFANG